MRLARITIALLAYGACTACGWHAGLTTPEGADSIGVAFFDVGEDVLERDLSPQLQSAITAAIINLVDLRLVEPERSDLVITGRILDYRRRSGIRSKEHELLESAVRVSVEVELRRRSSDTVLARARGSVPAGYVTADRVVDPGTGDVSNVVGGKSQERAARERALRIVAEGLVLDLFAQKTPEAPSEPGTLQ